ncbi:hypothetical protein V5O48_015591 [Marasmius crinis-equi]|uniref:Uncharacterized protein n=1 Tax=Marasmius crinis-equi TaxID=585013 RepID=A0ABR3EU45_9AGAR
MQAPLKLVALFVAFIGFAAVQASPVPKPEALAADVDGTYTCVREVEIDGIVKRYKC